MKFGPVLLGIGAMAGCSDPASLSEDGPVGSYTAIVFTTTSPSGQQTNQLQIGSTLQINLGANGSTSGHLHVAASPGNPALDADMVGTWTQTGDKIDFTQAADTFVRDMTFRIEQLSDSEWLLVGDQVFSGTRINLTLAHQD
jgi:hypothetical protein